MSRHEEGLRSRFHSNSVKKRYERICIGDTIFIDDSNDPWFCISFNCVYIGDYCPCAIYINKETGKIKKKESDIMGLLIQAVFAAKQLHQYQFQKHHKLMLERFARSAFKAYNANSLHNLSLDRILITFSQQRV
jgi:hypothetical protein